MVDSQTVIIVNFVSLLLIRSMRYQLKNKLTRQILCQLQFKCTLANIRGLEHTAQILAGFDVFENDLSAIDYIHYFGMLLIRVLAFQITSQLYDFVFGPFF